MSLFEVDGWKLDKKIASAGGGKKSKKTKTNKKLNSQELQALIEGRVPESPEKESVVKPKKDSKKRKVEDENDIKNEIMEPKKSEKVPKTKKPKVEDKPNKALTPLQQKMMEKLSGSRFRWINEQLYTKSSAEGFDLIKKNPEMFDEYHKGFRSQVQSWPENPVESMVEHFKLRAQKPVNAPGGLPGDTATGTVVIADMGCGEAQLAADLSKLKGHGRSKKLNFKTHSFDLQKANERITVADIKNVPLADSSVDVVVFCLALMGTNFIDFITEAFRILKPRGELWIAEIKSRFENNDVQPFVNKLKSIGMFHKVTDDSNKMFIRFEFFKPPKDILERKEKKFEDRKKNKRFIDEEEKEDKGWVLKPCIYKRR